MATKKPFVKQVDAGYLGDCVFVEVDVRYSRSEIVVTLAEDTPRNTVLEETGGTWAVASAGTGKLGILMHDVIGSDSPQKVGVVDRAAKALSSALIIDKGILATAIATFDAQGVKVVVDEKE